MKNLPNINLNDLDPMKNYLLTMLQKIQENQSCIMKEIEDMKGAYSKKENIIVADSPLKLFINDEECHRQFIERLKLCTTTREWAQQAVYPLYEEEYLKTETIHSRRFIEATIKYCTNIKKANYEALRKQLAKCNFPK